MSQKPKTTWSGGEQCRLPEFYNLFARRWHDPVLPASNLSLVASVAKQGHNTAVSQIMRLYSHQSRITSLIVLALIFAPARLALATAADLPSNRTSLDRGFHLLYNLDFEQAHQVFLSYQRERPQDPVGPTAEAAGLLFSEFHRLGILETQFYADNKSFLNRAKVVPDPSIRDSFNAALVKAQNVANARLATSPQDRDALFAMTLSSGLQADYAAMIEKRNLPSLRFTREANDWAGKLLAVDPNCYDAHVATGFSKYIIGSMAAPVRWIMRLGGVSGDKTAGLAELQITADRGQYLGPFARILLAIAYVRDNDTAKARSVLASLRDEFPKNPLFAQEIAHLDSAK